MTDNNAYDEIDEAEEEALLKSDADEDDSLMNEAAQLHDDANMKNDEAAEDSDEDDDELDESEKALIEYRKLLKELEENQYVYDKHLRLCELSHATADLDNIRNAYNSFANVYPLAPNLWLKYIKVEQSVAISETEIEKVECLFRKALKDYYSIEVALEFAAFAKQCSDPTNIWQELLCTYGCHCTKGREFFKIYRQYLTSQEALSIEEKQDAYIESYLRELKYPLHDMEESYIEFKVFYEKNKAQLPRELDWQTIDRDYFKAKSHMEKIFTFEEQLNALEPNCYRERAEVYEKYIKDSDDFLDENVLQTIYERMVADCCLNADCWIAYIDFIDERDEVYGRPEQLLDLPVFQQSAIDISSRALRNCTWSEQLYVKRMQLLEKSEKPREVIQEVLESSMSAGFQTADPAVTIWMEYLTYLRRHTDWENEEECNILRKNFNLAWTILGQQWGVLADCNCEILQFWGRLEYGPLQNAKRGKELWITVMESADNATKSGLWIEFTQLEMRRDLEATRKLYQKSLHTAGLDNPSVIVSAWERFERCNGTIASLNACLKECKAYLLQYNAQYSNVIASSGKATAAHKGTKRKSNAPTETATGSKKSKSLKTVEENTTQVEKSKFKQPAAREHNVYKEHENAEIDLTKDHLRIFLSNLDYNLTEDDIRKNLLELQITNINLIRSANGRSRGFGYLELANEAEVEKALALDRRTLSGRPVYISSVLRDKEKRQKFKYSDGLEPKKLFVKSLPPDATKEEVEQLFSRYGKLKDVRLVYHKSGKFKNIGYIEFVEEAAAGKAVLGVDNTELRGHTISVAISAPPPKPTPTASTSATKLLGLSTKRQKTGTEQKPRMSLIPTIVRRQFTVAEPIFPSSTNGTLAKEKTNADFRKLLEK